MNLIPVKVRVDGNAVYADTMAGDKKVSLPFARSVDALKLYDGQEIMLGVRPEAITDPDGADRHSTHVETVENLVSVTEPAGSDTFVSTGFGGKDIVARMRADADVRAGQTVTFAINMEKAVPFDPMTENQIS